MKFIYHTNKIVYIITVALYITVIYGMLFQILLGAIQVIFFFVLLFNYDKFSKEIKQHLGIYGALSGIFLVVFFSSLEFFGQNFLLIIFIPMGIATYFTYIVYQLKQRVL